LLLLIPALAALAAAAPPTAPEDLTRRGNATFVAGDLDRAEVLYAEAAERTGDPGLVSFNKAAVLFQKGEFRAAEVHYARTLDDRDCPADRAARAWFNRGVCLLRRGGSAAIFRTAIACFERSLDENRPDESLKADTRYNLELAKLLWVEANKKAAKPELPNAPAREDEPPDPRPLPPSALDPASTDPGNEGTPKKDTRPTTVPVTGQSPSGKPEGANVPLAGDAVNPPLLMDDGSAPRLSPDETREYLRRAEARLREERLKMLKIRYGPDRPGVRDW
jgi:tetratricopeptide (TPR) repeat protein